MATTTQTVTGSIPSAFETYYTSGAEGQQGLIPQAFQLYGQATPQDFYNRYAAPLQEAGLYGAGRVAPLSDIQQQVGTALSGMTTPEQFAAGTQAAQQGVAGLSSLLGMQAPKVSAPSLTQYQMSPLNAVNAQQFNSPFMNTAQTRYAPSFSAYRVGDMDALSTPFMSTAQTSFNPALQRFQMQGPESVSAERAATGSITGPGVLEQYMSPYMQSVVDAQKREAILDAQRAQLGANLGAAKQGTYGGARQAVATAEREKALGTQLGDIQARGSQAAYEAAQKQFEAEQGRGLQAQQLNIQSGLQAALANQQARQNAAQQNLQAALGVQQLGTQTGLQTALANLSSEQQANVQNQAAQLQTQGLNAEQALRTALANQQAGLSAQQLMTQTGMQTALANLSAEQQANVQNQAAQLQTQGLNADQALRAALANQQTNLAVGQQNLAAQLGVQQLGAGQSLEAQRANQAAALQAAQQQMAASLGLGSLGAQLGQLGIGQQAAQLDYLKTLGAYGDLQRGFEQQQMDARYADLMRGIQYPETQLQNLSSFIRGIPLSDQTMTTTTPPPSFASQLAGMGLSGLSLYNLFNPR